MWIWFCSFCAQQTALVISRILHAWCQIQNVMVTEVCCNTSDTKQKPVPGLFEDSVCSAGSWCSCHASNASWKSFSRHFQFCFCVKTAALHIDFHLAENVTGNQICRVKQLESNFVSNALLVGCRMTSATFQAFALHCFCETSLDVTLHSPLDAKEDAKYVLYWAPTARSLASGS